MRPPYRKALTLVELLLVIALLGVLTAIAWPSFLGALEGEQLAESSTRMKALVSMCRAQAMNEARRYRLTIYEDGTIRVTRQLDAVYAPQVYMTVHANWCRTPALLDHVWVESVLSLPDGPPPFQIQDELIEFEDYVEEPIPVTELDAPLEIDFEPDGVMDSAKWVLRHTDGRGMMMTVDGRLGRVTMEPMETVPADDLERPEPLEIEDEYAGMSEADVLSEYLP